ncbi:MAG: alcohol dehydrogenase catalytic domain-containing protein [Myxococcales bacterium]|nr:alcohol dehydrogenase catalytic domain-containing protein [Myxococcales bacterium]
MRALYFDGEQARVVERPDPVLAGRVGVRVSLAGVCATDLEITRGYMDYRGILGHEFVGCVEEGPTEWIGSRVVGEINIACGTCASCRQNLGRHCPNRSVIGILGADGAFAERIAMPIGNLHRVPDSVPDEAAVFTEPLAAAFEILEQVKLRPEHRVLVFGDGRLGLLISQVMQTTGASVTTIGKHPEKLALMEARGIATCLLADWDASSELGDIVVEATGSSAGFARAIAATRPRGTMVLKSTVAHPEAIDLSPLVINEIQVVGSRCGPFAPALAALEDGSVEVEAMIAERYGLEQAEDALAKAGEGGVLKVLIDCGG